MIESKNTIIAAIKLKTFLFIYFILFATLITKNIGKEEEEKKKKEVARRPNRDYRSL